MSCSAVSGCALLHIGLTGVGAAWGLFSIDRHRTNKLVRICAADQWDAQPTIQRLNELLLAHGYATWFDLTNMKGSKMVAMCDAIEG